MKIDDSELNDLLEEFKQIAKEGENGSSSKL